MMSTAHAQGYRAPMDEVVNAVRSNRVTDISRYFDNFVPININNSTSNYSRNQAELVLHDFFDKNPPRDFKVMDSGSPSSNTTFTISAFSSPNGRFNIYILMRQKDNTYVIKEIRISKE
ncbi:MAG: DUF4783 domain-containing protein [Taibaiella sp.]|nr:DUF4783 domain-containing protein [Taibaiella sp.]